MDIVVKNLKMVTKYHANNVTQEKEKPNLAYSKTIMGNNVCTKIREFDLQQ